MTLWGLIWTGWRGIIWLTAALLRDQTPTEPGQSQGRQAPAPSAATSTSNTRPGGAESTQNTDNWWRHNIVRHNLDNRNLERRHYSDSPCLYCSLWMVMIVLGSHQLSARHTLRHRDAGWDWRSPRDAGTRLCQDLVSLLWPDMISESSYNAQTWLTTLEFGSKMKSPEIGTISLILKPLFYLPLHNKETK